MATHLCEIKVGDKTYNLSHNEEEVYYSTSNKTGGSSLKGVKFKNNQIISKSTGKVLTEFQIGQIIQSL